MEGPLMILLAVLFLPVIPSRGQDTGTLLGRQLLIALSVGIGAPRFNNSQVFEIPCSFIPKYMICLCKGVILYYYLKVACKM